MLVGTIKNKGLVVKGSESLGTAAGTEIGVGINSLKGFTDQGLFTAGLK